MSESDRVWDLLQRAYEGNAWHGPALRDLLGSVDAGRAALRPVSGLPSIWQIVLHVGEYEDAVRRRLAGENTPELAEPPEFAPVEDTSARAWRVALDGFEEGHRRLRQAVASFPAERMSLTVPGRDYPYYLMLYGVIQHDVYHAGHIEVLLGAQGRRAAA